MDANFHETNVRVSDECCRFGAGKFSEYITVLMGPVFFQGWPEDPDALAALPQTMKQNTL
jgi:hypothetical protein